MVIISYAITLKNKLNNFFALTRNRIVNLGILINILNLSINFPRYVLLYCSQLYQGLEKLTIKGVVFRQYLLEIDVCRNVWKIILIVNNLSLKCKKWFIVCLIRKLVFSYVFVCRVTYARKFSAKSRLFKLTFFLYFFFDLIISM